MSDQMQCDLVLAKCNSTVTNYDVIFEVAKCGEILQILSAYVMGKMQMWRSGYATSEHMPIPS